MNWKLTQAAIGQPVIDQWDAVREWQDDERARADIDDEDLEPGVWHEIGPGQYYVKKPPEDIGFIWV